MLDADLERVIDDLPVAYAVALRLEAAKAQPGVIAKALGTPLEAVTGILELAHAKARQLIAFGA